MPMTLKDLTGMVFGRLTVLNRVENNKSKVVLWLCSCECDKTVRKVISSNHLTSGRVKSCGCLKREMLSARFKKYNKFLEIEQDTIAIYSSNSDDIFLIDKHNFEKIYQHCWRINAYGYAVTTDWKNNRAIYLSRLIMNFPESRFQVDHIDRNKLDNRERNLRVVTSRQNTRNRGLQSNNKSGIIGVWETPERTWNAYLIFDDKIILNKVFKTKIEAIIARLKTEKEIYVNEDPPQKYLFDKYGI